MAGLAVEVSSEVWASSGEAGASAIRRGRLFEQTGVKKRRGHVSIRVYSHVSLPLLLFQSLVQMKVGQRHCVLRSFDPLGPSGRAHM